MRSEPIGPYTAMIEQRGAWWIGWLEQVPGVNAQAATREEVVDDLRTALVEALSMNRAEALGVADRIRFLNQFRSGKGNWVEEREALLGDLTLDEIMRDIERHRG